MTTTAADLVPAGADLDALRAAAATCTACELAGPATQTVFGRGPSGASMVLVGEAPGDVEDERGAPFVGPAGHLLVRALGDAGIDKSTVYVTNAVKHFRFTPNARGRRIHQTPDVVHITACRPWLTAELRVVRPVVVLILGATAGKSLLGKDFRVTKERGKVLDGPAGSGAKIVATLHPSAVLRTDEARKQEVYAGFVADLHLAQELLTPSA